MDVLCKRWLLQPDTRSHRFLSLSQTLLCRKAQKAFIQIPSQYVTPHSKKICAPGCWLEQKFVLLIKDTSFTLWVQQGTVTAGASYSQQFHSWSSTTVVFVPSEQMVHLALTTLCKSFDLMDFLKGLTTAFWKLLSLWEIYTDNSSHWVVHSLFNIGSLTVKTCVRMKQILPLFSCSKICITWNAPFQPFRS